MVKALILFALVGLAAYLILGHKTVSGTVTALYSGVVVTPSKPTPSGLGDSNENALIAPDFASTNY